MQNDFTKLPQAIGWREWASLPELSIKKIKAKIDTGARTSALHAFEIEPYHEKNELWVRLHMRPSQKKNRIVVACAKVIDQRWVTDSGGHREFRYVIMTHLKLGNLTYPIEMTLTNRDNMRFRMLLGRTALQEKFIIHPHTSFLLKKCQPVA